MQIDSNKSTVVAGGLDGAGYSKKRMNTAISFLSNNQAPIKNKRIENRFKLDSKTINKAALHHSYFVVARLLPHGFLVKGNYISSNPHNPESKACSFRVDLCNGTWNDCNTGKSGKCIISLTAHIFKTTEFDATLCLAKFLGMEV